MSTNICHIVLLATCSIVTASAARAQAAEPPKAWAACVACHSAAGSAAIGPNLVGVVGRKSGTVPGFNYSKAMKNANIEWNDESLAAFLADPQQAVPGNRMAFPGLPDPGEVAELVRYLQTMR